MKRLLHPRVYAAGLLGISLRKLDYLVKAKALKVVRIGKRILVPQTELERFVGLEVAVNVNHGGGRDGK